MNPVDTYIRAGQYAQLPELPYTPGRDGSGIVEQVSQLPIDFSHREESIGTSLKPQDSEITLMDGWIPEVRPSVIHQRYLSVLWLGTGTNRLLSMREVDVPILRNRGHNLEIP